VRSDEFFLNLLKSVGEKVLIVLIEKKKIYQINKIYSLHLI